MYQRLWHGLDLTSLPAGRTAEDQPVGAEFYAQFYEALAAGRGRIDPVWLANKRQFGEIIQHSLITPWQRQHGRSPRILALGSGNAPVERVWHEHGHAVTFHDCQEASLAEARRLYPSAGFLIGDIFKLTPEKKYDLVTLITIDYVMNRREFVEFLARAARWLDPGGQIVIYCASTLSFRQMAVEVVKRALGRYRNHRQVFWGYWRTPGEFFKTADRAGLRVAAVYHLGGTALQPVHLLVHRLPPWRSTHLVVTVEPKP